MRPARAALLLALLAALAPPAAPQVPEPLALEIEPFPDAVQPLAGVLTTNLTARASCTLLAGGGGAIAITYAVVAQPAWSTVLVSPATDQARVERCEDGVVTFEATLTATASDQAPAFQPAPIEVEARVAQSAGESPTARASADLVASFFPILDVQVPESIKQVEAGTPVAFPIKLTNFGNGPTLVTFEVVQAENATAQAPEPVRLGSKQRGDDAISADAVLQVVASPRPGVNGIVSLRYASAYAEDASLVGDDGTLSFVIQTHGDPQEEAKKEARRLAPGAGPLLLAGAAAGAALLARRRRA